MDAPLSLADMVFEKLQIVSDTVTMHAFETLFSNLSLQFPNIISNSDRMYHFTVLVFKITSSRYQWPTTSRQSPPPPPPPTHRILDPPLSLNMTRNETQNNLKIIAYVGMANSENK